MKIKNSQNPLTLVIFGATGNLYSDKLAKALFLLFQQNKLPEKFNIIAFARRDLDNKGFRIFTKESILKRGEIDVSKLDQFLNHLQYFQGDFIEAKDFIKLKNFISAFSSTQTNGRILLHIATASKLYEKIFKNIHSAEIGSMNKDVGILIEKPFGKSESDARRLQSILSGIFKKENIFHVDHYLAKETTKGILDFRWKNNSLQDKWNKENIAKIKIIFHESNLVGSRGASYDTFGAFADVGQNHMLELLAFAIMDKPRKFDSEHVHAALVKALSSLYIDQKLKITKGQYEGYHSEPGVDPHSVTETFFRVFLRSNNPNFSNVCFELESGKGLVDMHSDITSTTVSVEIYFRNGEKKELKIQPVLGTVYESYTGVYANALAGDQTLFVSIEEIILEWKLADELFKKWKNIPLLVYKKGSRADSIK